MIVSSSLKGREMTKRVRVATNQSKLFGPPPILPGEDPALYQGLLAEALTAAEPRDIIDRILVVDFINETWTNVRRLTCAKEGCLDANLMSRLDDIIRTKTSLSAAERRTLLRGWRAHQRASVEQVQQILSAANLPYQTLFAMSLQDELEGIERIDRLLGIGQARRAALLRALEHRRMAALPAPANGASSGPGPN
jgi:hypothetical protein